MNAMQKVYLWVGIAAFVLMGLFPPWMVATDRGGYVGAAYAFLLCPPVIEGDGAIQRLQRQGYWQCRIDVAQLSIQWFMVAVVTGGLILTRHESKVVKRPDKSGN